MPIQSWPELQTYARKRFRLQRDEAQFFVMGWELAPVESAGTLGAEPAIQGVHAQHLSASERSFVVLRAEVCSERAISPREALLQGSRLLLGALVLSGNHYVLRCALPLGALAEPDLDFALQYIAREAALLRARAAHHVAPNEPRPKGTWSE